jgi:hypothetical protein
MCVFGRFPAPDTRPESMESMESACMESMESMETKKSLQSAQNKPLAPAPSGRRTLRDGWEGEGV